VFPKGQGFAHAVLNCRGHGDSPAGDLNALTIVHFTDDLAQMIDLLPQLPVAVGGISMGAAMALRLAVTRPDLVRALILSRPAWVTGDAPANMQPNALVGQMLAEGLAAFEQTETARSLAATAPDNLVSLRSFFARPDVRVTKALLTRISADGPGVTEQELRGLSVPTLIMGSAEDAVHPMTLATELSRLIPGAILVELPPKGRDKAGHVVACQAAILSFLKGLTHASQI
jgi:pimeloyl-ACP methyl ester carboxylesterase